MSMHRDVFTGKILVNLYVNRRSMKNADTDALWLWLIVLSYFLHTPQLHPASEPIYF